MTVTQNFSFTSTINARFVSTGNGAILRVTGQGRGDVGININWNDNPNTAGDALGTVTIAGVSRNTNGENGNTNFTVGNLTPGDYGCSFGNINPPKEVSNQRITFIDNDGNDTNGEVRITGINQDTFSWSQSAQCFWNPGGPTNGVSGDNCCSNVNWFGSTTAGTITVRSASIDRGSGTSVSGSYQDCLGQSVAGSSSPLTRQRCATVTRSDYGTTFTVQECATYTCRNDTDPNALSIPTRANPNNVLLTELEPNTTYTVDFGQVGGIDAPTQVRSPSAGLSIGLNNGGFTTGNLTVNNGNSVQMRFTSSPFNTSQTSGGTVNGEIVGQYNPASGFTTYTMEIGSGTANDTYTISVRTRRPVIGEAFNYELEQNAYPFPDIDTVVPNPNSQQYWSSSQVANDIEIPVEIKTNNGDAQVRLNNGSWQNMRQI